MRYPWFKLYPKLWLLNQKVMKLTYEERGIYFQLLVLLWEMDKECTLLDDDIFIAQLLSIRVGKWKKLRSVLIEGSNPVLFVKNGMIYNKRLTSEYFDARKRSENGKYASDMKKMKKNKTRIEGSIDKNSINNDVCTKKSKKKPSEENVNTLKNKEYSLTTVKPEVTYKDKDKDKDKDKEINNTTEDTPTSTSVQKQSETVKKIFTFWKKIMNHPKAKLDPKRSKAISARLMDGYTEEDIKKAILGCKKNPFNMGQNDNNQIYDDIELICRDVIKLEKYLNYNPTTNIHKNSLLEKQFGIKTTVFLNKDQQKVQGNINSGDEFLAQIGEIKNDQ